MVVADIANAMTYTTRSRPACLTSAIMGLANKKCLAEKAENYKLFALVNVLARIISSVYCSRLKPMRQKIIPCAQTGSVPCRTITKNVILTQDTMH